MALAIETSLALFSILSIDITFSYLVTLSVCLGFDDVTLYQSLHDLLKPVMEKVCKFF